MASERTAIPFHKPFRPSESGTVTPAQEAGAGSISALYMSTGGPPTFEPKRATMVSTAGRYSQKRARVPPTFNLMVVGGKGTGKTSLLRLLLETADISPNATLDQRAALNNFLKGTTKSTQAIQTACVEICESRFDRILFSVIDTPGLDFSDGRELKLERQVNNVIKYLDAQYADTMNEESKVVRQNKGDQHIHLCIYMIDPSSVTTADERGTQSTFTEKTHSETAVSNVPDLVSDNSSDDDTEDESVHDPEQGDTPSDVLSLSPAEIRVIRRISARANVLPVIAHSDSLTDEKLQAVKKAVRSDLLKAGIDLGVFAPPEAAEPDPVATPRPRRTTKFVAPPLPSENGHENGNATEDQAETSGDKDGSAPADDSTPTQANGRSPAPEEDEADDERASRPVIKLRASRHRPLSRSRSRRDLHQVAEDERRPSSPDSHDRESVANVRFSAHIVSKEPVTSLLPFALIAPEPGRRRPTPSRTVSTDTASSVGVEGSGNAGPQSDHGSEVNVPNTPASMKSVKNLPFMNGPPESLKGVFVRKYRWGTIDVLDPNHCDFAAMRTAILSTHLKLLKIRTKEVLYEKYRTEKLLARRATAQISEEQRQRLLEGL
ncbi:hypothetical protein NMY22_g1470 [Coprinellus aureogranulatus]|nr:hypothetical protein NMY22_g1470 [Coprinellus aureogranulatus]